MKQKLLFIILLMLLPLSMMAEVTVQPINGIYYELDSELGTAKVAANTKEKYKGDIVIPSTVEFEGKTYTVTTVGTFAFFNCQEITHVSLPETVRTIEDRAFSYCYSLTGLDNVDRVTRILTGAFMDCRNLDVTLSSQLDTLGAFALSGTAIRTVSLPQKMHWIPDEMFSECTKLEDIHMPDTVYSIGNNVFHDCSSLQDFQLPKGLTYIGNDAFWGCSRLKSFVLPSTVTHFTSGTLAGCSSLTKLAVEDGSPYYDSREDCNCIIETATDRLLAGCAISNIPQSVTKIAPSAFRDIQGLGDMVIPEGISQIGGSAFDGSDLTSVTMPSSLQSVGNAAFEYCKQLRRVTFDRSSVETIGNNAFIGCENLRSVVLPETLTSIGSSAFVYCDSLEDVYCFLDFPVDITDYTFTHYGTLHLLPGCTIDFAPAAIWNNFNQVEDLEEWVTGIGTPQRGTVTGQRYDLSGRRMPASQHGVSILRTPDGKTKKILY